MDNPRQIQIYLGHILPGTLPGSYHFSLEASYSVSFACFVKFVQLSMNGRIFKCPIPLYKLSKQGFIVGTKQANEKLFPPMTFFKVSTSGLGAHDNNY